MSNIIQIKRGVAAPGENNLAPYELGYVVNRYVKTEAGKPDTVEEVADGGYLYIGDLKKGDSSKTTSVKIKAGYADEAGIANGLSANGINSIVGIKVTNATNADSAANALSAGYLSQTRHDGVAFGQQYFIASNPNETVSTADFSNEYLMPTKGVWYILKCNCDQKLDGTNQNSAVSLALPDKGNTENYSNSIYFKNENSAGSNRWKMLVDSDNFSDTLSDFLGAIRNGLEGPFQFERGLKLLNTDSNQTTIEVTQGGRQAILGIDSSPYLGLYDGAERTYIDSYKIIVPKIILSDTPEGKLSYGTSDPPPTATEGQLYFKVVSG